MLKKISGLAAMMLLMIQAGTAQTGAYPRFSLNLPAGYTFDETSYFDGGKMTTKGAFQYGGALEFFNSRYSSIEVSYQRMDTEFPLYGSNGKQVNSSDFDGSLNYVLLGGNKYVSKAGSKSMPYFGGGVGVGVMNYRGNSDVNFGFNLKGGVKLATQGKLALKLQAYLQSMTCPGGTDYWVSGGGAVVAVPERFWIFQFGLGGVLCFDFTGK